MGAFFDMGGYAAFIWPAYAVVLLVLGALVLRSVQQLRRAERELVRMQAMNPRRQRNRRSEER